MPMVAMNRPIRRETRPLIGESVEMKTAQERPKQASQKYSGELNLSANSASAGAENASTRAPNTPPIAEVTRQTPSASSAWPLPVILKASSTYAADAGVPGMRSSVPEMSPAKIAMALAAMIAPIAGTGSMKKVIGTSSAVAIVAVRPGSAPTTRPNTDASRMTPIT